MEEKKNTQPTNAEKRKVAMFQARSRRISFLAIGACVLLLIVALVIAGISMAGGEETDDGLILPNVYVAGVNLGGMDRSEAESALRLAMGDELNTKPMVITLPDDQLILSPEDTEAFVNVEDLVAAAYNYGRSGTRAENRCARENAQKQDHVIALLDYMYLDLEYIRDAVRDFCNQYSSVMTQSKATLTGARPDYKSLVADGIPISSVKHQTLTIQIGTPQFVLDSDVLYDAILDAYSLFRLSFSYEAPIAQEPDKPDAQALFDLYCTLPEDATMDSANFQITPEIYGYGFDVAEVARLIHRADFGETITITLGFLFPEITEEDLAVNYFQDVLATYISTNNTHDTNRDTNLRLACEAINGLIIKSGERFDFNQVLGPRTVNAGYKSAPTYYGSSTNTIGGGISQVASVLHYCALLSGLQVDEYHLHKYFTPYAPFGTDAAITYGSENFVFTNTSADPIQIFASFIDGSVIISFLGTEEDDFTTTLEFEVIEVLDPEVEYQYMTADNVHGYKDGHELQSPIRGYVAELFLCKYDPVTGEEISRESLRICTYNRRNQILVKIQTNEELAGEG